MSEIAEVLAAIETLRERGERMALARARRGNLMQLQDLWRPIALKHDRLHWASWDRPMKRSGCP